MPYTHTTLAQFKTQLAGRLGDSSNRFWVDAELTLYANEALRAFGLLSAFWRERATLTLQNPVYFYDLTSVLSGSLLTSTVTDRDLIKQVQYMLLESTSTQASWPGTDMFTYSDLVNSLTARRNQFLSDTGIIITRSTQPVLSPQIGRQSLSDNIIDVRRCAWVGASPLNYYKLLWRSDEFELTAALPSWSVDATQPQAWSIMAPPPLQLQLAPPPNVSGSLDLLTVNTGPTLDPSSSATAIGIPDDLSPAIKWGMLADLLGKDGQARDPVRAVFCEQRYQQYVQLARLLSCVVNAEIQGIPILPESLYNLDTGVADWQNDIGIPRFIGLSGWNMLSAYPVPDSTYSCTLDVVRSAPIPASDASYIQVGREQIDMLLDYAEHLALFKVAGYEFNSTLRQASNFLLQAITYNQRLSASAKYIIIPKQISQYEKFERKRREQSDGLGAQPSIQEAQSFVAGNAPVRMTRN